MLRSHRWAVLLFAAAVLVPLSPPRQSRGQAANQAGVEVQARGPVHEAFASLTADPAPTAAIRKKPPAPLDELPPEEKPDGEVIWIGGYWAFDEDRDDFIWVSGLWRAVPPGRQWVAGYWREEGQDWQWVPGFWTGAKKEEAQEMTYLPQPPETPKVAPPGQAPGEKMFYVPGIWVWNGSSYAWRAGYWARVQQGWTWVPDHYRWTPSGYVFIGGYWDLAVTKRGILYAPVYVSPAVRVSYTYVPAYAVQDTVIVDTLFVQPATCHYYFGDYYEARYQERGYVSGVVYSQTRYDSVVVYERYQRPANWYSVQITLTNNRYAGTAPVPPRVINQTVIQQNVVQQNIVQQNVVQQNVVNNNVVNNNTVNNTTVNNTRNVSTSLSPVAPTKTVVQNKNVNVVKVDAATRTQAKAQAQAVQAVSQQRSTAERGSPPAAGQVKTASLAVPKTQAVKPGMVAPKPTTTPPSTAKPATSIASTNNLRPLNSNVNNNNVKATNNAAVNNAAKTNTPVSNNTALNNAAKTNTTATNANTAKTPGVNTSNQRPTATNVPTGTGVNAGSYNRTGQTTQSPSGVRPLTGTQGATQQKQPAVQPKTTQPPPRRPAPAPQKDKDKK